MASFAELNRDGFVLRVVEVSDSVLDNGLDEHVEWFGVDFCNKVIENSRWVQAFENGEKRGIFPSVGDYYVEELDIFINGPTGTWMILTEDLQWECPIGLHPDTGEPLSDDEWKWLDLVYVKFSPPDFSQLQSSQ